MTTDEITLACALVKAMFLPGSFDKRFAASMAAQAALDSEEAITARQRLCLMQNVVRYRKQLPAAIVELARAMIAADCARGGDPQGVIEAGAPRYDNPVHQALPLPG